MAQLPVFLHAQKRVAREFRKSELERLLREAVAAAEQEPGWQAGQEYEYEIEDEEYVFDEIQCSHFLVCHTGARYEVYYFNGLSGELYTG